MALDDFKLWSWKVFRSGVHQMRLFFKDGVFRFLFIYLFMSFPRLFGNPRGIKFILTEMSQCIDLPSSAPFKKIQSILVSTKTSPKIILPFSLWSAWRWGQKNTRPVMTFLSFITQGTWDNRTNLTEAAFNSWYQEKNNEVLYYWWKDLLQNSKKDTRNWWKEAMRQKTQK